MLLALGDYPAEHWIGLWTRSIRRSLSSAENSSHQGLGVPVAGMAIAFQPDRVCATSATGQRGLADGAHEEVRTRPRRAYAARFSGGIQAVVK